MVEIELLNVKIRILKQEQIIVLPLGDNFIWVVFDVCETMFLTVVLPFLCIPRFQEWFDYNVMNPCFPGCIFIFFGCRQSENCTILSHSDHVEAIVSLKHSWFINLVFLQLFELFGIHFLFFDFILSNFICILRLVQTLLHFVRVGSCLNRLECIICILVDNIDFFSSFFNLAFEGNNLVFFFDHLLNCVWV
jgi:hypothetical protein